MVQKIRQDSAVSPVIGTILLVAITVVLIAIIAAVVMGMMGNPQAKEVGMTVTPYNYIGEVTVIGPGWMHRPSYGGVVVVIHGGRDATELTALNITVIGNATGVVFIGKKEGVYADDFNESSNQEYTDILGVPLHYALVYDMIPGATTPSGDGAARIIVTGTFTDGTEQVIYNNLQNINSLGSGDGYLGTPLGDRLMGIFGDGITFPSKAGGWADYSFEKLIKPESEGGLGFRQSPNITRA